MRKISVKKYVAALYAATATVEKKELKPLLANFVALLAKNKNLSLAKKIMEQFLVFSRQQLGVVAATVWTVDGLGAVGKTQLTEKIKKEYQAREVEITEEHDASLLGGAVVRIGDQIWDGSLQTSLANLKTNLKK